MYTFGNKYFFLRHFFPFAFCIILHWICNAFAIEFQVEPSEMPYMFWCLAKLSWHSFFCTLPVSEDTCDQCVFFLAKLCMIFFFFLLIFILFQLFVIQRTLRIFFCSAFVILYLLNITFNVGWIIFTYVRRSNIFFSVFLWLFLFASYLNGNERIAEKIDTSNGQYNK